jgi:hypothetical protein
MPTRWPSGTRTVHALARSSGKRHLSDPAGPDPDRWQAAVDAWDKAGQPYPAAYARWRQAEALLTRRGGRAAPGGTLAPRA